LTLVAIPFGQPRILRRLADPLDTAGRQSGVALAAPVLQEPLQGTTFAGVPVPFLETFDGHPAHPEPWRPPNWDVTVHSRDLDTWTAPESMMAMHGPDCGAPPAAHRVSTRDDAVFLCNDHVMTSVYAEGYGVIYLTPNQLADFSGGEVRISFDVSTLRTSDRDWIDVWVTPYDENLELPLDNWLPDLNGEPRDAIHVRMDQYHPKDGSRQTIFGASVVRNFAVQGLPGNVFQGYEGFLTPSATVRSTVEIRLSRTHVKVGMPQYNFWWVDSDIAPLDWSQGVVQLGHHSYNPSKNSPVNADGSLMYTPNTWHWDNFALSAAVPFTILHPDSVRSRGGQGRNGGETEVRFDAGAPANASLRFAAQSGKPVEISFDDGATWSAARVQGAATPHGDHFQSYWTTIPAGATQILVRGSGGYWGPQWLAEDFSIWAPVPPPDASAAAAPSADTSGEMPETAPDGGMDAAPDGPGQG
jgi:hypothetical protein